MQPELVLEPESLALSGGLRYVASSEPGIIRQRSGRGFQYRTARGQTIRNTTLLKRHVSFVEDQVHLRFIGKSGLKRHAVLTNPLHCAAIAQLQKLRGRLLFQYRSESKHPQSLDSYHVNEVLRRLTRSEFSAKDFRTWKASAIVAGYLHRHSDAATVAARKK